MCCINPHWAVEGGKRSINVVVQIKRAARVGHSTGGKEKGERESCMEELRECIPNNIFCDVHVIVLPLSIIKLNISGPYMDVN